MKRLTVIGVAVFKAILFTTTPAWSDGKRRELIFENQSTMEGNVCVYQSPPITSPPGVMTLAWFCQPFPKQLQGGTSQVVFQWTEDYYFVWFQTGKLASGITFTASQTLLANLKTANEVTLHKSSVDSYTFTEQQQGSEPNILFIEQAQSITPHEVLVGIGMDRSGTALVQALPNLRATFKIDKNPIYWIFIGNYKIGQVLNETEITNKAEIQFQGNVNSMMAVLRENNTWCIQQTGQSKCSDEDKRAMVNQ